MLAVSSHDTNHMHCSGNKHGKQAALTKSRGHNSIDSILSSIYKDKKREIEEQS